VRATLSIGVTLDVPGEGADSLIARADRAMYAAKRTGRDQVITLSPTA
jgi:PleD family two-component response regulator